jgi:hypothetical protein
LGVYGISQTMAVTWAIGFHLLSFIPITLIGAYYFARAGLTFSELRGAGRGPGDAGPGVRYAADHSKPNDDHMPLPRSVKPPAA